MTVTLLEPAHDAATSLETSKDAAVVLEKHPLLAIIELLLKDPGRLDDLARDEARQRALIPCFLAIGLASFGLFAVALVSALTAAPTEALPPPLRAVWDTERVAAAVALGLAYTFGFTLATGVCLPSFYFYTLLAGVRISWAQVAAQIMKGQAATAVMLLGVLPIYCVVALGAAVFGAPLEVLRGVLLLGFALPFVAGLWGVRSIYRGFLSLSDTLPPARRGDRECWLRRLTAACSACYTAVCPVMIYSLWVHLVGQLAGVGH